MQASSASPRDAASSKWFTVADSAGPALWAASIALASMMSLGITWWHPSCDDPDVSWVAYGFPLPYAQRDLVSWDFFYMPHVGLVNVAFVALIAYPIFRWLFRWGALRSKRLTRGASLTGLVLFALMSSNNVIAFSQFGYPVWSIADHDSYWSYRPSMVAIASGHKECYFGWHGMR